MKKTKLSLEKFRVAKLNNLSKITGGNDETGRDTHTEDPPNKPKCVKSRIIIRD